MTQVLIVDDVPAMVEQYAYDLKRVGRYHTSVAAGGEEALDVLAREPIDCVVLDLEMPGVDGFRATRTLANDPKTKTIPIIMVTSKGQETDKIWGLRQGAVDYMVKPVSPDQLVAKAQATLAA